MSQGSAAAAYGIPNEIISMIVRCLHEDEVDKKKTLYSFRLANRRFNAITIPFVFDIIRLGRPIDDDIAFLDFLAESGSVKHAKRFDLALPRSPKSWVDVYHENADIDSWMEEYSNALGRCFGNCCNPLPCLTVRLNGSCPVPGHRWMSWSPRVWHGRKEKYEPILRAQARALASNQDLKIENFTMFMHQSIGKECFWDVPAIMRNQKHTQDQDSTGHHGLTCAYPGPASTTCKHLTLRYALRLGGPLWHPPVTSLLGGLRSLTLISIKIDGSHLLGVFERTTCLEYLNMATIELHNQRQWVGIFNQLATISSLTSVDFHNLREAWHNIYLQPKPNKDYAGPRVLEAEIKEPYDALERLVTVVLGRCKDEAKRESMRAYLLPENMEPKEPGMLMF